MGSVGLYHTGGMRMRKVQHGTVFIRSEQYSGAYVWAAFSAEIKAMLGLRPGEKLPHGGMVAREVQGITVWVEPLPERVGRARRFALRVKARCPVCSKVVAVSRLRQHSAVHNPRG